MNRHRMSQYDVAVVGTGPDPNDPTLDGFAMGYRHAEGYESDERFAVAACADIVPENAAAFAATFGVPDDAVFEDYAAMLDAVEPDVVSVAVPPAVHERVVVDCARHDAVGAVHCEKPIADTWDAARRMVETAWRYDTQLTFNRQRRFAKPFTEAKRLLDEGAIGDLRRIEIGWGDFYDTGAHTVDLAGMMNDDEPPEWVLAGLDYREEDVRFGAHQENQMLAEWGYANGVAALLATGERTGLVDAAMVLRGTEGSIRVDPDDGPTLELRQGASREAVDVDGEGIHATGDEPDDRFGSLLHDRAVAHLGDCLESGEEPVLSGRRGLNTAEVLFGGYHSVRERGRVEFPLEPADNALEAMVETGALTPEPADEE